MRAQSGQPRAASGEARDGRRHHHFAARPPPSSHLTAMPRPVPGTPRSTCLRRRSLRICARRTCHHFGAKSSGAGDMPRLFGAGGAETLRPGALGRKPRSGPEAGKGARQMLSGIAQVGTEQPSMARRCPELQHRRGLRACLDLALDRMGRLDIAADRRRARRPRKESPECLPEQLLCSALARRRRARALRGLAVHRPMRPALSADGSRPARLQHAACGRDMALLAAMRRAGEREFFFAKAIAIGRAGFDQHERLQGLDGRARIHRASMSPTRARAARPHR